MADGARPETPRKKQVHDGLDELVLPNAAISDRIKEALKSLVAMAVTDSDKTLLISVLESEARVLKDAVSKQIGFRPIETLSELQTVLKDMESTEISGETRLKISRINLALQNLGKRVGCPCCDKPTLIRIKPQGSAERFRFGHLVPKKRGTGSQETFCGSYARFPRVSLVAAPEDRRRTVPSGSEDK